VSENGSIESDVRRFLATNFPLGRDVNELANDAPLLDAGIIDSTGVLELVDFLEDRFSIRISDDELVPENLNSIGSIVRFLGEKQAA
jgi:acyl carrier protein